MFTMRSYTMEDATRVAKLAAEHIEEWLRKRAAMLEVLNVEDDPIYRLKDIDLIYKHRENNIEVTTTIEIKGDRYHYTGNYFFETVSNEQKNTPGCFMYSEAEYLFYYFVDQRELHIIPLRMAREWFETRMNEFEEKKPETKLPHGAHYNTVGRLVPRKRLQEAIDGIKVIPI